ELMSSLREEGNYKHETIKDLLEFWDNIESNQIFLIFDNRNDFEKTALTIQWQYLNSQEI
ncbi:MAG: hypothetical protein GY870_09360, partial [archaeon]|nr:hypothetical protein [archaeon]